MDKTEEFILKARKVHGDYYDYSKTEYIHSKQKVTIICPIHGDFSITPSNHLLGYGCKDCKRPIPEWILERQQNNKGSRNTAVSIETFIERSNKIHNNKYDYSFVKFSKTSDNVIILCPEHGEFVQKVNNHLNGSGCPKCGRKSRTMSVSELKEQFEKIHNNKYDYDLSNYSKQSDKIKIYCKKHNYWFEQTVIHHLKGCGCKLCNGGGGKKFTTDDFITRAKEVHGELYDYSKVNYKGRSEPVEIICSKHGSFWQKPHDHLSGCGCPKCKVSKTQYKIFKLICDKFPNEHWDWEASPKWLGLQRFDIYNAKYNFAIEYNGEQHYMPIEVFGGESDFKRRVELDKHKIELCRNNNCTLFIIKYDYKDKDLEDLYNNIQNIINNET